MPLSNSQYDEITREYNAKQLRNQHVVEQRKREAYAACPRLEEIDHLISSYSVSQAKKLLLSNDTDAITDLKAQLAIYKKEHNALLAEHGYGADYFEPPYDCKDCKDTGYIENQRCHCFKQRAIDLVYTQSNIRHILEEENFSRFSYKYYSRQDISPATGLSSLETIQNAVDDAKYFIQKFDEEFDNLFFYGDTGVGKTFLSNCIAKELLDSGHSVIYFTAFQFFDLLAKDTFEKNDDIILSHQNIFDCDLLILDDLGTEMSNSFTTSQLFLCLNERILRKRSTIISTNLMLTQFSELYSERTFSRISSHYTMLKLFGDDIRIQKKIQGDI